MKESGNRILRLSRLKKPGIAYFNILLGLRAAFPCPLRSSANPLCHGRGNGYWRGVQSCRTSSGCPRPAWIIRIPASCQDHQERLRECFPDCSPGRWSCTWVLKRRHGGSRSCHQMWLPRSLVRPLGGVSGFSRRRPLGRLPLSASIRHGFGEQSFQSSRGRFDLMDRNGRGGSWL